MATANRNQRKGRLQAFTLMEVMIVLLILGILAAFFGRNVFGQTNDAKISIAVTMLTRTIPDAMINARTAGGLVPTHVSSTGATFEPTLWARGVNDESPWGDRWLMSNLDQDRGVTIYYPTGTGPAGLDNARHVAAKIQANDCDAIINVSVSESLKDNGYVFTHGDPGVRVEYQVH